MRYSSARPAGLGQGILGAARGVDPFQIEAETVARAPAAARRLPAKLDRIVQDGIPLDDLEAVLGLPAFTGQFRVPATAAGAPEYNARFFRVVAGDEEGSGVTYDTETARGRYTLYRLIRVLQKWWGIKPSGRRIGIRAPAAVPPQIVATARRNTRIEGNLEVRTPPQGQLLSRAREDAEGVMGLATMEHWWGHVQAGTPLGRALDQIAKLYPIWAGPSIRCPYRRGPIRQALPPSSYYAPWTDAMRLTHSMWVNTIVSGGMDLRGDPYREDVAHAYCNTEIGWRVGAVSRQPDRWTVVWSVVPGPGTMGQLGRVRGTRIAASRWWRRQRQVIVDAVRQHHQQQYQAALGRYNGWWASAIRQAGASVRSAPVADCGRICDQILSRVNARGRREELFRRYGPYRLDPLGTEGPCAALCQARQRQAMRESAAGRAIRAGVTLAPPRPAAGAQREGGAPSAVDLIAGAAGPDGSIRRPPGAWFGGGGLAPDYGVLPGGKTAPPGDPTIPEQVPGREEVIPEQPDDAGQYEIPGPPPRDRPGIPPPLPEEPPPPPPEESPPFPWGLALGVVGVTAFLLTRK